VDDSALLSVAATWTVVVIVPGPDFVTTAHAAAGTSRRAGIAVVAGIAVGTTIWAVAALVGLGAALRTSALVYDVCRLAGAVYLLCLGLSLLASSRRRHAEEGDKPPRSERLSVRRAFVRGLLTDLTNPKAAVFFTSLFALAIPAGSNVGSHLVVVAMIPAIAGLWYGTVAVLASGPLLLAYHRAERAVLALAGALIAAFGLRLAIER
jgi:threonine/homoserine/homoserine lactone efflux protein